MNRRDILKAALAAIATPLACIAATRPTVSIGDGSLAPAWTKAAENAWRGPEGHSADMPLIVEGRHFGPSDQAELDEILETPHLVMTHCYFFDVSFRRAEPKDGSTFVGCCYFEDCPVSSDSLLNPRTLAPTFA